MKRTFLRLVPFLSLQLANTGIAGDKRCFPKRTKQCSENGTAGYAVSTPLNKS